MARLTKAQREAAAAATGEAPSASTSASSTAPVGAAVADAAEDTLADVAGEDILDEAESNGNSGAKRTKPRGTSLLTNAGPRAKSRSSGAAAAARSSPSVGAAAANEDNEYSSSAAGAAGSAGAGARRARSASESEMSTSEGSSAGDEEDQLAAAGAAGDDSRVDGGGDDDDSMVGGTAESPEVKCMWEDCGMTFTSLQPFINHLHDDHVGIHKARYACEWTGCPRKGKAQTSRFALLSHLRSHTGEKPFTCPRPECDKSFTRSDALAKHMRVQHNINPTTSRGRGSAKDTTQGSGGRASRVKGEEDDDWASGSAAEGGAGLGGAGGSGDALDDELLGLAEGPASGMDLDQSLTLNGAASAAFTYENLFETGASADAKDKGPRGDTGELDGPLSIVAGLPMTDEELGIVRDQKISSNVLLNDEDVDEEALAKEHKEMDQVLEMARREWVRREREKAKIRLEEEKLRAPQEEAVPPPPLSSATIGVDEEMVDAGLAETNGKRPATSYDSEEEAAGAEGGPKNSNALAPSPPASKRPRRASQRNLHASSTAEEHSIGTTRSASKSALVTAQQTAEATKLTKVYLIEKAKLRLVKDENARLKAELERLRVEERWEKGDKRKLLERCLEAELGRDVGAIFSPPPSPGPGAAP